MRSATVITASTRHGVDGDEGVLIRPTVLEAGFRQGRGGTVEVVGVVGSDAEVDQTALGFVDDPELLAAVGGGEPRTLAAAEAELLVVGGGLLDVRDADGHVAEAVQTHDELPFRAVRTGWPSCPEATNVWCRSPIPSMVERSS